jgi:N-acetylglutamate synthase
MTTDRAPSARRVEEASLNAWPALHQILLDGWVLRFARGFTKRANSVVPVYESQLDPLEKIRFCENLYVRERQTPIFRLTSITGDRDLDHMLALRGYQRADATTVMSCPLDAAIGVRDRAQDAPFVALPRADWLTAYARITGIPEVATQLHALLLNGIRTPHEFGAIFAQTPVACGLAVLEAELVGLFDVATDTASRRRGHGRRLVEGLLDWGRRSGARHAYLQVLADNLAARQLYEGIGFSPLYSYWYRIAPP